MKILESTSLSGQDWSAEDVAFISEMHWVDSEDTCIELTVLIQPRKEKFGEWPNKNGVWYRAVIRFGGVRDLGLRGFDTSPCQVMGFSIESIADRGLESAKYCVHDFEDGKINFFSKSVIVTSVEDLPAACVPF